MQRAGSVSPRGHWTRIAAWALACVAVAGPLAGQGKAPAGTLERIRKAGKVTFGYRVDARPFSYKDESGNPAGYSVALCMKVADAIKTELKVPTLGVNCAGFARARSR